MFAHRDASRLPEAVCRGPDRKPQIPPSMKITRSYRGLLAVALAGVLASAGTLRAADREDRIEDAFKRSHVYKTELHNCDLNVDARNGVAVLKGTVENEDQRRLAEDTVRGLPGVERVDNQVRVTHEPKESSDEWIGMKVRGALLFHRNVSATDTHVNVHEGVVVLTGTAASEAEKALAAEYANDIKGVRRIDNQIQVVADRDAGRHDAADTTARVRDRDHDVDRRSAGDAIDDASITAQVKSSLAVRKSTSALRTSVTTRDGIVTITGDARNGAEKDLVTKLAENIDGVRSVRNEMNVRDHE